ncbi:MAG: YbfB/YjiJ family MFS transporter [Rhodomicrobium sp.]
MAAAIGIGRFVYTPILPVMLDALHWGKADAGYVASSNFLGYLAGAMAATRKISPGRQRLWLLAALVLSAVTTAGMALDSHLWTFLVLRLAGGAASAFVIVLASALVLEQLSAARQVHLPALHFAGVGAGIMVSATLVSAMLAAGAEWQTLWIGAGIIALAATALVSVLIPRRAPVLPAPRLASVAGPARGLPLLAAAYGLFGFGYVITATFLVTIVRMAPEVHALEAWIWALFGFAAVPSVALWSWVGQRLGLMAAFALACFIEAAGVAASVEWVSIAGVSLSAILLGGTFMGLTALGLMATRQLAGVQAQGAIGLMTASFATGQMIGPLAAGVLFERLGSLHIASLAAVAALLASTVLAAVSARANVLHEGKL